MMTFNINTVSKITMTAIAALGMLFAPGARACGTRPGEAGLDASRLFAFLPAFQTPPSLAEAQSAPPGDQDQEEGRSERRHAPIVGMWTVNFYVERTSK